MVVAKMQKINILSHISYKDSILAALQALGIVEIKNLKEEKLEPQYLIERIEEKEIDYDLILAESKFGIDFLEHLFPKKRSFIESLLTLKLEAGIEDFTRGIKELDYKEIIERCKGLEMELGNLRNLENKLNLECEMLYPWEELDAKLNEIKEEGKVCITLGKYKSKYFRDFKNKLERLSPYLHIEIIKEGRAEIYMLLLYMASEQETIRDFLSKTEFERIILGATERSPKEEIQYINTLKSKIALEKKDLLSEAASILKFKFNLMCIYDYFLQEKLNHEIRKKIIETGYTFVLGGWIRNEDFNTLSFELKKLTDEVELLRAIPQPGETPPIVLENPPLLQPFETITRIFGLPMYKELDPTLALSVFFALFFGLCLGDAGYGIVLMVLCLYFLKKFKLPQGGQRLIKLLLFGSFITVVVGILTGGWFGVDLGRLPPNLKTILSSLQIIDPIKNPLAMLGFSLSLGCLQILFGIALQGVSQIRKGKYLDAFLDNGLWLYFLITLLFLIIGKATNLPFGNLPLYMAGSGAILLVLTQGRYEKSPFKKIISGILSLYKTTGYMGDVLSYSRLLALGMTTSIIGMVINIVAQMARGSLPIFGYVIMAAILLFGHAFNLAVGILGAFIHSARLQLVEFFTKFYEGGGREFKPFRREERYITIIS